MFLISESKYLHEKSNIAIYILIFQNKKSQKQLGSNVTCFFFCLCFQFVAGVAKHERKRGKSMTLKCMLYAF